MDADAVQAAMNRHLPPGAACAVVPVDGTAPLLADELAAVIRAVPRRRHEFAAGRAALRRALDRAGVAVAPDRPIPVGPDRRPLLPVDARVSLAHDHGLAVAVAVPGNWPGGQPGIDIEPDRPPFDGLDRSVAPFAGCAALDAFVAKESAFKAAFPAIGRIIDFGDMDLVVADGAVDARVAGITPVRGRLFRAGGRVIALTWHRR